MGWLNCLWRIFFSFVMQVLFVEIPKRLIRKREKYSNNPIALSEHFLNASTIFKKKNGRKKRTSNDGIWLNMISILFLQSRDRKEKMIDTPIITSYLTFFKRIHDAKLGHYVGRLETIYLAIRGVNLRH